MDPVAPKYKEFNDAEKDTDALKDVVSMPLKVTGPVSRQGHLYEWLVQVEDAVTVAGDKSCTPVFRSVLCGGDMPTSYHGCATLKELHLRATKLFGNRPYLGWRLLDSSGIARHYVFESYSEVRLAVEALAWSLCRSGLSPGDRIGIYGINSPEYVKAMQATTALGAICVPLYDSLGPGAVEFIINHSEMRCLFVQSAKLPPLMTALASSPHKVENVVVWGCRSVTEQQVQDFKQLGVNLHTYGDFKKPPPPRPQGSEAPLSLSDPSPESPCTIMYTSGTTGQPKGVVISHRALISVIAAQMHMITSPLVNADEGITGDDAHLSYLPLAHIYERVTLETMAAVGARVGFWQGDIAKLQSDLATLRPTVMVGVPRVWERIRSGALAKIERRPLGIAKRLFRIGLRRKTRAMLQGGKKHKEAAPWFDKLVFSKIKGALGGRLKLVISGAAPLAYETEEFIRTALCCYAVQGYGMTETCSATTCAIVDRHEMWGTVGPVLPCAEFMVESVPDMNYDALTDPPRGELCLRGPCLFSGYFHNQQETDSVMDKRGFFHTGDIVELCPSGALKIIDRKKNIFKLAQGEYVAVERVESVMKGAEVVEQVFVYGEGTKRKLVAVVVPNKERLSSWAAQHGHGEQSFPDLCGLEAARSYVLEEMKVQGKLRKLAGFEMVYSVHLHPEEFSPENGLLTPTHKLKRHELRKNFEEQIQQMYASLGE